MIHKCNYDLISMNHVSYFALGGASAVFLPETVGRGEVDGVD
jgi:hypothetical protein